MTLLDVISDAKYGELKQLGVAKNLNSADAATKEDAERQVISYINLGLIELFKRFALRTEEATVDMVDGTSIYSLANLTLLNKIYAIYDENGDIYPLNVVGNSDAILTPSYNTLQIPNPSGGNTIFVIYASAPDRLVWAADLSTINVPIPPIMLEALLHYIGYRGHGANDGNVDAENNTHYMRFENSCNKLIEIGATTEEDLVFQEKMEDRGWA